MLQSRSSKLRQALIQLTQATMALRHHLFSCALRLRILQLCASFHPSLGQLCNALQRLWHPKFPFSSQGLNLSPSE